MTLLGNKCLRAVILEFGTKPVALDPQRLQILRRTTLQIDQKAEPSVELRFGVTSKEPRQECSWLA